MEILAVLLVALGIVVGIGIGVSLMVRIIFNTARKLTKAITGSNVDELKPDK